MSELNPNVIDFTVPDTGVPALPLARALKSQFPDLSWNQVKDLCRAGKVTVKEEVVQNPGQIVEPGTRVVVSSSPPPPQAVAPRPRTHVKILFEDSQVVVIEKPAGISTVPFEAGERNTVLDLVRRAGIQRVSFAVTPESAK